VNHPAKRRGRKPRAGGPTKQVPIRLTHDEHVRWRTVAEANGLTFSGWIRMLAERELARVDAYRTG